MGGLGDSLSSLEKRSAQPWWGGMAASNSVADPRRNLWIGKRSAQPSVGRKANEAVSEADAEGVYGVGLGDSLSSLEKRSAQPYVRHGIWGYGHFGKNADEAVSEADAEGVYGVGLGDSLSSLEKRSAQPYGWRG